MNPAPPVTNSRIAISPRPADRRFLRLGARKARPANENVAPAMVRATAQSHCQLRQSGSTEYGFPVRVDAHATLNLTKLAMLSRSATDPFIIQCDCEPISPDVRQGLAPVKSRAGNAFRIAPSLRLNSIAVV